MLRQGQLLIILIMLLMQNAYLKVVHNNCPRIIFIIVIITLKSLVFAGSLPGDSSLRFNVTSPQKFEINVGMNMFSPTYAMCKIFV